MSGGNGEDTLVGRSASRGEDTHAGRSASRGEDTHAGRSASRGEDTPGVAVEERIVALRDELDDALWCTLTAPLEIDGTRFTASLEPPDGESMARALRVLGECGLAVVIRGGGSRMGLGNPPRGADLLLSTRCLAGVDEFEPAEGVLHAGAGTGLEELRAIAQAEGWELAMDPPGQGTTLGGVIASAAIGPRYTGFGPVRDSVLGLEVALATGERTRCGGRVVKNVTGYDLAKLYTGSLGTLGVIEGAWLRLRPQPEVVMLRVAEIRDSREGIERGIELGRRSSARVAALLSSGIARSLGLGDLLSPGSCGVMVCELAGDAVECEGDARWLEETLGASQLEVGAASRLVGGLRARLGARLGPRALRARIALTPGGVDRVCEPLAAAGAELIVQPSAGLVFAELSWEDDDAEAPPKASEDSKCAGAASEAA
ncbi:MAG: FAD-binding oxidoreductase, partial [Deltaproteobacteria bacterium]|nr:FAD-binding oxidoreductase [Deltaproteobacteria bacterium]